MQALPPGQCRTKQPQILIPLFAALQTQALQLEQQRHASTAWSAAAQGTPTEQRASRTSCSTEIAVRAPWLLCIGLECTPASWPILQTEENTGGSEVCLHPFTNCDRSNAIVLALNSVPTCDAESLNIEKKEVTAFTASFLKLHLADNQQQCFWRKLHSQRSYSKAAKGCSCYSRRECYR